MDNLEKIELFKLEAEKEIKKVLSFIEMSDICESKDDFERSSNYISLAEVAFVKARALKDEYIRLVKEHIEVNKEK